MANTLCVQLLKFVNLLFCDLNDFNFVYMWVLDKHAHHFWPTELCSHLLMDNENNLYLQP